MTRAEAPIPIGQYIGEAEGALTGLLEGALQGADLTRTEYIALQILAQRGPFEVPGELHQLLVDARQLRLDGSGVAQLLDEVERKGLVVGTSLDAAGPVQLADQGKELHAKVRERVVSITKRLLADFDRADLETTRRVLVELVERAKTLSSLIWHVTMNAFIAGPDNSMDWVAAEWSDGGERPWDIEAPSMP